MSALAHILIICPKPELGLELSKFIEANNYRCCATTNFDDANYLVETNRIDIAILLSDEDETSAWFANDDCIKLKSSTKNSPGHIIAIGGKDPRSASLDGWFAAPLHIERLLRRMQVLLRLDVMEQELSRRIESMKQYKAEAQAPVMPPETIKNIMILAVGTASKEFTEIESIIANENTMVVGAFTYNTALEYLLNEYKFDAVIINIDKDEQQQELLELRDNMRRYPRLYNVPVIFLADSEKITIHDELLSDAATDFIAKPCNKEDLKHTTLSMAKEARFRKSMKSVYAEIRRTLTNDSLTGLYTHGFLRTHIDRIADAATETNHDLSVAIFKIVELDAINQKHGYTVGDQILNQVGSMIGMLVRGEDVPARYSGSEFAVVLPNTPLHAAQNVVSRIVGVIESTQFPSENENNPIRVTLSSSLASLTPGDTGFSLLEKAKGIRAQAA